jgi:hypothetical protein
VVDLADLSQQIPKVNVMLLGAMQRANQRGTAADF